MSDIRGRAIRKCFKANGLQPIVEGRSCTGFNTTVRNIGSGAQISWVGYKLHNNDAAARWLQVFFRPASQVVLGTTPPDDTILVGASQSIAWDFLDPQREGTGFSVACTTAETGSTGPTLAMTGSFYYDE